MVVGSPGIILKIRNVIVTAKNMVINALTERKNRNFLIKASLVTAYSLVIPKSHERNAAYF